MNTYPYSEGYKNKIAAYFHFLLSLRYVGYEKDLLIEKRDNARLTWKAKSKGKELKGNVWVICQNSDKEMTKTKRVIKKTYIFIASFFKFFIPSKRKLDMEKYIVYYITFGEYLPFSIQFAFEFKKKQK